VSAGGRAPRGQQGPARSIAGINEHPYTVEKRNLAVAIGKKHLMSDVRPASRAVPFEETFRDEFPVIHRYINRRLGPELANDIAAETFARAYQHWDRVSRGGAIRPWLYGVASNLIRMHHRDEARRLRAFARTGIDTTCLFDEDAAVSRADATIAHRRLSAALSRVRPRDRELFLLHAWADLNDAEIALALGLRVGTVKSRLHRLRDRLRRMTHSQDLVELSTIRPITTSYNGGVGD
jgi:RNA polymerase sigma factor (sigma-70 family)